MVKLSNSFKKTMQISMTIKKQKKKKTQQQNDLAKVQAAGKYLRTTTNTNTIKTADDLCRWCVSVLVDVFVVFDGIVKQLLHLTLMTFAEKNANICSF